MEATKKQSSHAAQPQQRVNLGLWKSLVAAAVFATVAQTTPAATTAATQKQDEQQYDIGPAQSWVKQRSAADYRADYRSDAPQSEPPPVEYLLIDRQIKVADRKETSYIRVVEQVNTQAAIEDESQLTINFDPQSERITFHDLVVHRGATSIKQLAVARKSVLHREDNLESGLIDGMLTLSILLHDVRPGDILEYSYTRNLFEPELNTRFYGNYVVQWSIPVNRSYLRIIRSQPAAPLLTQNISTDPLVNAAPMRTKLGELEETEWVWGRLPSIPQESDVPGDHILYPRIVVSEYADWRSVVAWALPMYRRAPLSSGMAALVNDWTARTKDPAERILLAMRFVQDEIRYTGIEIGTGAFKPEESDVVLQRRFGDCKDKAQLLSTLLTALGVRADVALVNTWKRSSIQASLPSPGAFNHAIVRAELDGNIYWLDATRSYQGGSLATMVQARFGAALVMSADTAALETIPEPLIASPQTELVETFDLTAGSQAIGKMIADTTYLGASADRIRGELAAETRETTSRNYLNYYKKWYPGIRASSPLRFADDRSTNRLVVHEEYEIEPAFALQENKSRLFELNPSLIASETEAPKLTIRTAPLRIRFPLNLRYKAVVKLPPEWNVEVADKEISDAAFVYRSHQTFSKDTFTGIYELRTLSDRVPAARIAQYAENLERAHNDTYYKFSESGEQKTAVSGTSIVLVMALVVGALMGIGILVLARQIATRRPLPVATENAPSGFGGWLLLPMLGTVLLPILLWSTFYSYLIYLDLNTWLAAGETSGAMTAQWIKLGVFAVFVLGSASSIVYLVAILWMFQRQRSYPPLYLLCCLLGVFYAGTTIVVSGVTAGHDNQRIWQDAIPLLRAILTSAIWITYMLRSERVRATFTRPEQASDSRHDQSALAAAI